MTAWSVTSTNPNSGTVQDLGNGQFNFPTNSTSDNIIYNVKYTDDNNCTASTTYTVTPSAPPPKPCSCDNFNIEPNTHGYTWEATEYGESSLQLWAITPTCIIPTLSNTEDFEMIVTTYPRHKEIEVYPKTENTTGMPKMANITFKGTDCEPFGSSLSLTQKLKTEILITISLDYYHDKTWAYGYYTTSNNKSAPFDIVMAPRLATKPTTTMECSQSMLDCERTLAWEDSRQTPDPTQTSSVWITLDGYEYCDKEIYEVKANGNVISNGGTLEYGGNTYKISWS